MTVLFDSENSVLPLCHSHHEIRAQTQKMGHVGGNTVLYWQTLNKPDCPTLFANHCTSSLLLTQID